MSINIGIDLRYAFRGLLSRPMITFVAIASLALGIGVNTALFSLLHEVILKPLPVRAPQQLVNLSAPGIKQGSTSSNSMGDRHDVFSHPMYRDLAGQLPAQFAGLAAHRSVALMARVDGEPLRATGMLVSGNYFALLGLQPVRGRLLQEADDHPQNPRDVAVVSHRFWQSRLAAGDDVLGTQVIANGRPLTIVGVAPAGFDGTSFGARAELFMPLSLGPALEPSTGHSLDERKSYWVYLFARLAPGATIEQAQASINLPYRRILDEVEAPLHAELDPNQRAQFTDKQIMVSDGARGQSRSSALVAQPLVLLLAVAAMVLLIACLNVANLLLARGAARAGEFAIRASIGASRRRLLRQLLIESLLMALIGCAVSVPLAALFASGLVQWMPYGALSTVDPSIDGVALVFAAVTAVMTVLLFGLFPAWQLARGTPLTALRAEAGQTASRGGNRFRSLLAIAQLSFATLSLAMAGLFIASLGNIANEDTGMRIDSLVAMSVVPVRFGYQGDDAARLNDRIEQALRDMPGVTAVTTAMVPLLANSVSQSSVIVEGQPVADDAQPSPAYNQVGVGFFETVGIPLLAGREFRPSDNEDAAKVAIVNRRFAEVFGLGPNPVGKRIGAGNELDTEIVGLVEDSKYSSVTETIPPLFVTPRAQSGVNEGLTFYVRSAQPSEAVVAELPKLLATIEPSLQADSVLTVTDQVRETIGVERFAGQLTGAFAVLATLLAALGLYGMLSYSLSQRMREIGLRLALGAEPRRVVAMVFGQLCRVTLIGGALGLVAALLAGRAAQSMLFGLDGNDPFVLGGATLLLVTVAALTGWLPARRAGRIDPMVALRHE